MGAQGCHGWLPGDGIVGCPGMARPGAGAGGRRVHPPDSHSILAVDLLHGLDVGIQLRVTVQVGGAGSLWHRTPRHHQTRSLPAAPHSELGSGWGSLSPPGAPSTHGAYLDAVEELLGLIVPVGVIVRPVLALEVLGGRGWGTGD